MQPCNYTPECKFLKLNFRSVTNCFEMIVKEFVCVRYFILKLYINKFIKE